MVRHIRTCPICQKDVKQISNHLSDYHHVDKGPMRDKYLEMARNGEVLSDGEVEEEEVEVDDDDEEDDDDDDDDDTDDEQVRKEFNDPKWIIEEFQLTWFENKSDFAGFLETALSRAGHWQNTFAWDEKMHLYLQLSPVEDANVYKLFRYIFRPEVENKKDPEQLGKFLYGLATISYPLDYIIDARCRQVYEQIKQKLETEDGR